MVTDTVGISDNIGEEIERKQREQLVQELEAHQERLEDTIKLKERHARQLERDRRIYELRLKDNNHRKIIPVFKHEELDEYWDLIKEVLQDEFVENIHMGESKQEGLAKQIELISNEITRIEGELKDFDEE